jgi:hypothetical protein
MQSTVSLATLKNYALSARYLGGWVNFYAHTLNTPPWGVQEISTADFAALVKFCNDIGLKVITWTEAEKYLNKPVEFEMRRDIFSSCAASATNNIITAQSLGGDINTPLTIAAQPDHPRTLYAVITHTNLTAATIEIKGINSRGQTVIETFTFTSYWDGVTSNAFAKVTSVKIISRTGTGSGDTINVGAYTGFGLSGNLVDLGHISILKKNNAALALPAAASSLYGTIPFTVTAGDTYEVVYKAVK